MVEKNNVPNSVKPEIKSLNPRDVIINGDENHFSKTTDTQIKSTVNVIHILLKGSNIYETS
nr:hypothetical protein [Clostridioides difficile]